MAEESDIRITAWPEEPLAMRHRFDAEEPCQVAVRFEPTPAIVQLSNGDQPLAVNMAMDIRAREPVPLCLSLCEPICARSDYTVTFDIFDQPVGRIVLRGLTRIFNCREEPEQPDREIVERCVDFRRRKQDETFAEPLDLEGVRFRGLEGDLRVITWGAPEGRNKLLFTAAGVAIALPEPASRVAITLINHFGQSLNVALQRDGVEIADRVVAVDATPQQVVLTAPGITHVVVSGGGNEAAVVEFCWTPAG